jgi:hypothetical protein
MASTLPPGELLALSDLITTQGIAGRVLTRTAAGNITLFAFDTGEDVSEHTAAFDALVRTLSGSLTLTIGGCKVITTPQSLVLMPANVPHARSRDRSLAYAADHAARTGRRVVPELDSRYSGRLGRGGAAPCARCRMRPGWSGECALNRALRIAERMAAGRAPGREACQTRG